MPFIDQFDNCGKRVFRYVPFSLLFWVKANKLHKEHYLLSEVDIHFFLLPGFITF